MTLEGWIFVVGLRVFDVGALIVWLVWFFKLRDDEDDDAGEDDDFRRDDDRRPRQPPPPSGPPDLELPKPDADPWPHRRRDHLGDRRPSSAPARPPAVPRRTPARRVPAQR